MSLVYAVPPVIQVPPVSQSIEEGSSFYLSTTSPSSPSLTYQWFRNGQIIPGANSANYELHNVGTVDQGEFQVRLESGNSATWSQGVELEVAPQIFRPGMIDTSFSIGSVTGAEIKVITPASDGNLYLGGSFEQIGGHPRTNIARVHSDGSIDLSFDASLTIPGVDTEPEVRAIALDSKNRIVVGGRFTHCNGLSRQNIARLHPDGSLDLTFNPGANGEVNTILFDQHNRLLIGGTFTNFGNTSVSRLAILTADDSLDYTFTNRQSFDGSVEEIISHGNRLYVAGGFTERMIRLTQAGAHDETFDSYRPRSTVTDLVVLPNGELFASGPFSGGIIKLDSTGELDGGFAPRPNDFIFDLTTTEDGKLLVSGDFTRLAGESIRSVARLFPNGDLDKSFQPPSLDGPVSALSVHNGALLIGGEFDQPHHKAMRILPSPPVPPPSFPVITKQPRSQEIWPGSIATLSVALAEPFGKSFQWFSDNGLIFNETSPSLHLLNFGPEQTGNYYVVITIGGISVTSLPATLSLAPETGLAPRAQFEASPRPLSGSGTTKATVFVPETFPPTQVRPHIEIDHPKINDLKITLEAPNGTEVVLYDRNGRRGSNLKTTFDNFAHSELKDGAAPWLGTWKPDEDLSAFHNRSPQGSWTLEIEDSSGNLNGGSLEAFRLEFIGEDPEVNFSNWLHPSPTLEHLYHDQDHLYFTHSRWRNAPTLSYEYEALQGKTWVPFSPTLVFQENLGNNQNFLQWKMPTATPSKIIRLRVKNASPN